MKSDTKSSTTSDIKRWIRFFALATVAVAMVACSKEQFKQVSGGQPGTSAPGTGGTTPPPTQPTTRSNNQNTESGWVSGGGLSSSDAFNPWFLANTKDVHYCIQLNKETFGVSERVAKRSIQKAIRFWKRTLRPINERSREVETAPQTLHLKLATQKFHYSAECKDTSDIVFHLGQLTQRQRDYLKDPKKYVGIAVRTNYDPKKLRGRGFIYIAPETGPDAPTYSVKKPWSSARSDLLVAMLAHEIGHIFGLTNSSHPVMKKDFTFAYMTGKTVDDVEEFQTAASVAEEALKDMDANYYGIPKHTRARVFATPMFKLGIPEGAHENPAALDDAGEVDESFKVEDHLFQILHDNPKISLDAENIRGTHAIDVKFQSLHKFIRRSSFAAEKQPTTLEFFLSENGSSDKKRIATFVNDPTTYAHFLENGYGETNEATLVLSPEQIPSDRKESKDKLNTTQPIFSHSNFHIYGNYQVEGGKSYPVMLHYTTLGIEMKFLDLSSLKDELTKRYKLDENQMDAVLSGQVIISLKE